MSSLATHATRRPAFTANFYIAAATLIPVLFIAIALRSRRRCRQLLSLAENLARAKSAAVRQSEDPQRKSCPTSRLPP